MELLVLILGLIGGGLLLSVLIFLVKGKFFVTHEELHVLEKEILVKVKQEYLEQKVFEEFKNSVNDMKITIDKIYTILLKKEV